MDVRPSRHAAATAAMSRPQRIPPAVPASSVSSRRLLRLELADVDLRLKLLVASLHELGGELFAIALSAIADRAEFLELAGDDLNAALELCARFCVPELDAGGVELGQRQLRRFGCSGARIIVPRIERRGGSRLPPHARVRLQRRKVDRDIALRIGHDAATRGRGWLETSAAPPALSRASFHSAGEASHATSSERE